MKSKSSSEKDGRSPKSSLRENIEAILIAIVLALFIRTFIVQAFKIPSGSMEPTLQIGDHILVNKFIYGVKMPFLRTTTIPIDDPEREDIIVFKFPEDPDKDFIKRVVGIAGDLVEVRAKQVYVNQKPIESSYAVYKDRANNMIGIDPRRDNFGPVVVPKHSLFVMVIIETTAMTAGSGVLSI